MERETEAAMRYENEIKGKAKQVKGTAKAELGKLTNDRDLESSGEADRAEGHVQETFGKAKRKIGEAIEDLGGEIAS
jgi:uncharacterized protein YjbJ (UPF0337 family)